MPDKFAARSEEFDRLVTEQATATRSMQYDPKIELTEDQRAIIDARAARLIELAELMGPRITDAQHAPFNAEAYVNERIASWMRTHPLALMNRRLAEQITADDSQYAVSVQIGEPTKGGYLYQFTYADLRRSFDGPLRLHIPEEVAEHFRQAGRRALQREVAASLALKSFL